MLLRIISQLLDDRKKVKRLNKELIFRKGCEKTCQQKASLNNWLFKSASLNKLTRKQLVDAFYKLTSQQGIDNAGYQLWLSCQNTLPKPVIYDEQCFLSLLGASDKLLPEAQQLIAKIFHNHSQVLLVYTDHDELDESGARINPHFKPAWNLDLFYSINYLGSSVFVRRDWYEGLELSSSLGLETLLWKMLPSLNAQQIFHLPVICYHSFTNKITEKTREIDWLILRVTHAAIQTGCFESSRRLLFPLPKNLPLVSLIIPTKDQLQLLQACIKSILEKTNYANYEIIIVNNNSQQHETLVWLNSIQAESTKIKVLNYQQVFNYSAINNFAVKKAQGSIIGLVNNDIEVINTEWLDEMVSHACRTDIGCVGAKLYYPDGRIQHAGVILGSGGGSGHAHRYYPRNAEGYLGRLKLVQNFTAVTGACLLVRKSLYEAVGGLNEKDLPIAWSDIDLCLKIQQLGYRNLWTPYAELYHHESVSRGRDRTKQQRKRYLAEKAYMYRTWKALMYQDPCYNSNLTVMGEGFSLGLPPDICKN